MPSDREDFVNIQKDIIAREARDMAAIKAREAGVLAAIERGELEIECGSFGMSQLQLLPVVADKWGRLWLCDGTRLVKWWGMK